MKSRGLPDSWSLVREAGSRKGGRSDREKSAVEGKEVWLHLPRAPGVVMTTLVDACFFYGVGRWADYIHMGWLTRTCVTTLVITFPTSHSQYHIPTLVGYLRRDRKIITKNPQEANIIFEGDCYHRGVANARPEGYTGVSQQQLTRGCGVRQTLTIYNHHTSANLNLTHPPPSCHYVDSWQPRILMCRSGIDGDVWRWREAIFMHFCQHDSWL